MGMKKTLVRSAAKAVTRHVTTKDMRVAAVLAAGRWANDRLRDRRAGAPAATGSAAARKTAPGPARKAGSGALLGTGLAGIALALPLGYLLGRRR